MVADSEMFSLAAAKINDESKFPADIIRDIPNESYNSEVWTQNNIHSILIQFLFTQIKINVLVATQFLFMFHF